jgi:hypothetical protein
MRGWIGRWLVGVGVLHTLWAVMAYRAALGEILADGVWNAVAGDPRRGLAFWFLLSGGFVLLLGAVTDSIERRTGGPVPRILGSGLLLVAAVGILVEPPSGFWLFLPPALAALRRAPGGKAAARHDGPASPTRFVPSPRESATPH